ncbi:MAG: Flp pilus assembly protein CpaB [Polyangiaceae bacterium]
MNRRALLIAVIVAVLGVALLVLYQSRFETEASGGEKIKILIAVMPIERGKVITEEMVSTREVPQAYVEDRAIKEVEKAKILGLRVGNTVQAQQTMMWTDLVTASEERRDLSSLIQPGNRAVSVQMAREDSSVALIRPGDYVDVIAIMPQPNQAQDVHSAVVLFQRVLVLATGLDTSPDAVTDRSKAEGPKNEEQASLLTLSLTTPEAQLLALAGERGKLAVALRNPEDQRTAERIPDVSSNSLLDSDRLTQVKGTRRGGTAGPSVINEGAK